MKTILLFGAGKSATILIDYLIQQSQVNDWRLVIADENLELARSKSGGSPFALPVQINVNDNESRNALIGKADVVISMLPPWLHLLVAENCISAGRHLLTASYADEQMKMLAPAIKQRGILFLCEMGLDPGIDHMSAMHMIHRLKDQGAHISSFVSHCGGLVAPESDDNSWHYKISWNPRNVVTAGKAGAVYKQDGQIQQLPYSKIFDPRRSVEIVQHETFAWYPNRDSLLYIPLYGLEECSTFVRTTLRHPDFCTGWKKIVELQLTDETKKYNTEGLRFCDFFTMHLKHWGLTDAVKLSGMESSLLNDLGLFDEEKIDNGLCTAADVLQKTIEKKLLLRPTDKDMIIMQHEMEYLLDKKSKKLLSTLVVKGKNASDTAMAKTVGLPLGIAATRILRGEMKLSGLHIPIIPEIYNPVLNDLEQEGIAFQTRYL